jgi:phospholipid/cholesterol/gamma-HCH transport system substrate-binding protein
MRRGSVRLALALLAVMIAASGCSLPGRVEGPVQVTAIFDDIGDLFSGHSVQVADVRVGSVTKIELTKAYKASVTMKIKDGLGLPANALAILRTTSLLGEKFIELRPPKTGAKGELRDGATITATSQAPELEFVAEQAVDILGAVAANQASDLAVLVETGAVGFGGRQVELGRLIDDLSVISGTLASQSGDIVAIIEGLDKASSTLAAGADDLSALLVNLVNTTEVLAANRDRVITTLAQLTRLAKVQNEEVFRPYLADVSKQVKQLDAIVAAVHAQREEVGLLIDWLAEFGIKIPKGIPDDSAQVFGLFCVLPAGTC